MWPLVQPVIIIVFQYIILNLVLTFISITHTLIAHFWVAFCLVSKWGLRVTCKLAFHLKISYKKLYSHVNEPNVLCEWKVLYWDSLWNRSERQLGNHLLLLYFMKPCVWIKREKSQWQCLEEERTEVNLCYFLSIYFLSKNSSDKKCLMPKRVKWKKIGLAFILC